MAMTCGYFEISRQRFDTWRRRYDELGAPGVTSDRQLHTGESVGRVPATQPAHENGRIRGR